MTGRQLPTIMRGLRQDTNGKTEACLIFTVCNKSEKELTIRQSAIMNLKEKNIRATRKRIACKFGYQPRPKRSDSFDSFLQQEFGDDDAVKYVLAVKPSHEKIPVSVTGSGSGSGTGTGTTCNTYTRLRLANIAANAP